MPRAIILLQPTAVLSTAVLLMGIYSFFTFSSDMHLYFSLAVNKTRLPCHSSGDGAGHESHEMGKLYYRVTLLLEVFMMIGKICSTALMCE